MRLHARRPFLYYWFWLTVSVLASLCLSDWHYEHRWPEPSTWIFVPGEAAIGAALLLWWKGRARMGPAASSTSIAPSERVLGLMSQGKKIEAIRLYREETGAGLKASKDAVEQAAGVER